MTPRPHTAFALLALFALPAAAHDAAHEATVEPAAITWTLPAAYAEGAEFAVIHGDPTREGFYVVRLRVPAGFRIAPHTHPNDENVTVLSGSFNIGTGATHDETRGQHLPAGGFSFVPHGMQHYAWFTEDTVIQLHGMGPQGIVYVDPADDPRQQ